MKKIFSLFLFFSVFLFACGAQPTPAPEVTLTPTAILPTSTPNPCAEESLAGEVKRVHSLTREFDDYSMLASNVPQAQLLQLIPELQRILRAAEDQTTPPCLQDLKDLQLQHMRLVVQTLVVFMNATDASSVEQISAAILQARDIHLQYDAERARLLGATLTPAPTTPTLEASGALVKNISAGAINLRGTPSLDSPAVAILPANATIAAYGRTENSQWIQVDFPDQPGQRAWVYAQLVTLSVPIAQLPVVTP